MRKLTRLLREEKKACEHWFKKACIQKRPKEEAAYEGYVIPLIYKAKNKKSVRNHQRRKFV